MTREVTIPETIMRVISLAQIDEGQRFREDYGDLTDLKFSISSQGLINPISVMEKEDGSYLLVAGGRRLRAMQELKLESTPVRVFKKFDELTLRLLELAENIQRKDMSWQEQNRLQREIHKLQQQVHGVASPHSSTGWKLEDTANMLGVSKATISESISLGEKLDRYQSVLGDVKKFKTENEARKAVKAIEEAMVRSELARRVERRQSSNSFVQEMADRYMLGDCVQGLRKAPNSIFDFAEVDPPYGINLDETKMAGTDGIYQEVKQEEYLIFTKSVMKEVFRVLKPNTFCIWWFGIEPWLEYIYKIAIEVGFQGTRSPLIWTKPNGQSMNPSGSLAPAYETAFIFRKGSPILGKPGRINIFDFKPVLPTKKYHPTQKPLELYMEIYQTFSFEAAQCVCPFAGSGASLIAAASVGRKSVGWDLSEEYKGGYIQLVNQVFLQEEGK